MNLFLNNVNGLSSEIKETNTSMEFPTPSDAMFASFYFKYGGIVTTALFDDLFTLFQRKEFRPDSMEFKRTDDLMDYVAIQMRTIANLRVAKRNLITESNGRVPSLAVELVVQHLETERTPFYRMVSRKPVPCEVDTLLQQMSLVHRSWTDAAQRNLRKRIFAKGPSRICQLLQSPQLGPWVRELSITTHVNRPAPEECDEHLAITNYAVIPRLVHSILRKCPNIRDLYLRDFQIRTDLPLRAPASSTAGSPYDIIHEIGGLASLENLWLYQCYEHAVLDFPKLSATIKGLKSLKSLSLQNWRTEDDDKVAVATSTNTTGYLKRLEFLSLTRVTDTAPLSSFLMPPSVLELSLGDTRYKAQALQSCVEPFKEHVTKLILAEYYGWDDIRSVAESFPSLQFLCLRTYFSSLPERPFYLPISVNSLQIHFDNDPEKLQDPFVIALLKASPHIRHLFITYNKSSSSKPEAFVCSLVFTKTILHCEKFGVSFELKEIGGPPYDPSWREL